jgi:hypothetical protein
MQLASFADGARQRLLLAVAFLGGVMADIRPAYPEDDVFRDIGGVIGNALQIPGHE